MILRGKKGDGQGLTSGAGWLREPFFKALLGDFHPASLNVFVSGAHRYAPNENYPSVDYIRQQGGLFVRDCKVNGKDGFLLRCEHPGPNFQHKGKRPPPIPAPHTMFEVVARSLIPGLDYASDITLEFLPGPEHLRKLPLPPA
jgi:hypothetical protein